MFTYLHQRIFIYFLLFTEVTHTCMYYVLSCRNNPHINCNAHAYWLSKLNGQDFCAVALISRPVCININEQGFCWAHCPYFVGTEQCHHYQGENRKIVNIIVCKSQWLSTCLLYTSPSPRDISGSRMPSSA